MVVLELLVGFAVVASVAIGLITLSVYSMCRGSIKANTNEITAYMMVTGRNTDPWKNRSSADFWELVSSRSLTLLAACSISANLASLVDVEEKLPTPGFPWIPLLYILAGMHALLYLLSKRKLREFALDKSPDEKPTS